MAYLFEQPYFGLEDMLTFLQSSEGGIPKSILPWKSQWCLKHSEQFRFCGVFLRFVCLVGWFLTPM